MWYGGGCDLTPFYVFEDDFTEFHAFWRRVCDKHDPQARCRRGPGRAPGLLCLQAGLGAARRARLHVQMHSSCLSNPLLVASPIPASFPPTKTDLP